MSSYEAFGIADFATDEYFLESCLNPSRETQAFWTGWLEKHPARRETWEEARTVISTLAEGRKQYALVRLPEEKVEVLWRRINYSVTDEDIDYEWDQARESRPFWKWGIAAGLLLAMLSGGYFWLAQKPQQPLAAADFEEFIDLATTNFLQYHNTSDSTRTYTLSDGSTVSLAPGGLLLYPAEFADTDRSVHLRGDAEFDIAHQLARPFIVYADQLVARVLGTRFRVFRQRGATEVAVLSGKVSVTRRKSFDKSRLDNALVLLPNQQVEYQPQKDNLLKTIVEVPVVLPELVAVPPLSFDNTPIGRVFAALEKTYGLSIVYDESALRQCTLTATLTDQPFRVQLGLICETIGASYETVDGQIVVSGGGC